MIPISGYLSLPVTFGSECNSIVVWYFCAWIRSCCLRLVRGTSPLMDFMREILINWFNFLSSQDMFPWSVHLVEGLGSHSENWSTWSCCYQAADHILLNSETCHMWSLHWTMQVTTFDKMSIQTNIWVCEVHTWCNFVHKWVGIHGSPRPCVTSFIAFV